MSFVLSALDSCYGNTPKQCIKNSVVGHCP